MILSVVKRREATFFSFLITTRTRLSAKFFDYSQNLLPNPDQITHPLITRKAYVYMKI
jgi:hypothetical protein